MEACERYMTDERFQQAQNGGKTADSKPAFIRSGAYISNESYTVITRPRDMAAKYILNLYSYRTADAY